MTTQQADPTPDIWSERLEEDLVEAGMEEPQARAYRLAFELGLTRVLSQTATKQELKDGLADLRDELRREIEFRFAAVDQRFRSVDQRFDDLQRQMDQRFADLERLMLAKFEEAKHTNRTERWLTRAAIAFIVAAQLAQLFS